MPKVPLRNLSLGEKIENSRKYSKSKTAGTKQFATHEYKESNKRSKHGGVKTRRLPQPYRREFANAMNHIRTISKEI